MLSGFFRLQFPDLFWHFSNAGKARTFFLIYMKSCRAFQVKFLRPEHRMAGSDFFTVLLIFMCRKEIAKTYSCQILKHLGRSHLCPFRSEVILLSTTLQGPLAVKLGLE